MPLAAFGLLAWRHYSAAPAPTPLRVCADPNNLPFSDSLGHGFENRIASLIADDFKQPLQYTWLPQRRGFVRNTLKLGTCDLIVGVPSGYELTLRTEPYYRSTYVFVSRADAPWRVTSLDDPVLKRLRIGMHLMGSDYANSPAAPALLRRGLIGNVHGYMIYGDYSRPHPESNLIDAVARNEIDVAIAWGPLAGYIARTSPVPLRITPVLPAIDPPFTPFVYDIAMGVRRGDTLWRARLDAEIERRRPDFHRILTEFGVPLLQPGVVAK